MFINGVDRTYEISQSDCYYSMLCRLDDGKRTILNDDDIQNKQGVYIFFDWDDKPLRIGKSVKVRNRLIQYYTQANNYNLFSSFQQDISYVGVIYVDSEKESTLTELDLLEYHKTKYNTHNV